MKTSMCSTLAILAVILLVGCSTTPDDRIKKNPELFATLPPAEQELIRKGNVGIGYSPDMVQLAVGTPDQVTKRIDETGTSEIWHYRNYNDGYYGSAFAGIDYAPMGPGPRYGYFGRYSYWSSPYYYDGVYPSPTRSGSRDYLKVVFKNGRVSMVEQEK